MGTRRNKSLVTWTVGIVALLFAGMALAACSTIPASSSSPSAATSSMSNASRDMLSGAASDEPAEPAPTGKTVVCIGDSITYGFGLDDPSTESWPALLNAKLGADWNVVNLGVSGSMLLDEGLFPYRSTGNIEQAKEEAPDIIFIMLGTNDIFDAAWDEARYHDELVALVDELAASTNVGTRFVLMTPPPVFSHENAGDEMIRESVRPAVEQVAAERGATYIDLYAFCENHPEWFPDGVHPNAEACAAIADYLYGTVSF